MTRKFEITGNELQISDGWHTFDELYEHRYALYLALCKQISLHAPDRTVWRSRFHTDGGVIEGWFVLGVGQIPGEQITYHLPESWWERSNFATEYDRAPQFDGHKSGDVLERLKNWQ